MKIILMRLRITIAMLEIRNRETLQSKVNICKSDVKIGDYADSLISTQKPPNVGPSIAISEPIIAGLVLAAGSPNSRKLGNLVQ